MEEQIDVVHVHNTLPLISPSIYSAAGDSGVPVVQTLHNYRLICPKAILFRDNEVCEKCVGKLVPGPAVAYKCYRDSTTATLGVVTMLTAHNAARTWRRKVDRYIVLTDFARQKFIEAGYSPSLLTVKPNFLFDDPGPGDGRGEFALFVGRLAPEKGILLLVDVWKNNPGLPSVKIVGTGPLEQTVRDRVQGVRNIEMLGVQKHDAVIALMKSAAFLCFPSTWYEGFPMTIVEAFACGLPVLASRMGSMQAVIPDGEAGLLFEPGDESDMLRKATLIATDAALQSTARRNCRELYENYYSAEANYNMLMAIYDDVRANFPGGPVA